MQQVEDAELEFYSLCFLFFTHENLNKISFCHPIWVQVQFHSFSSSTAFMEEGGVSPETLDNL